MASSSVSKKAMFKTVKAWAPKGVKLSKALDTAAGFGVKKGMGGVMSKGKAVKMMKELKDKHVLKTRVGARGVATAGALAERLVEVATTKPKKSEVSVAKKDLPKEHVAKKKNILQGARSEKKPKIIKALDTSFIDERNKGISKPASSNKRGSAAKGLGLVSSVSAPHAEAPKFEGSSIPPIHNDTLPPTDDSPALPEIGLEPTALEPGDPNKAIEIPI